MYLLLSGLAGFLGTLAGIASKKLALSEADVVSLVSALGAECKAGSTVACSASAALYRLSLSLTPANLHLFLRGLVVLLFIAANGGMWFAFSRALDMGRKAGAGVVLVGSVNTAVNLVTSFAAAHFLFGEPADTASLVGVALLVTGVLLMKASPALAEVDEEKDGKKKKQ